MQSPPSSNGSEGNSFRVSHIIEQMHQEHPSKIKSKEVVIDKDGKKKVRVVKKRRVSISNATARKKQPGKWFGLGIALILLLLIGGAGFFAWRVSSMNGESYAEKQQNALKETWNAASVSLSHLGMDGFNLSISQLKAEFPESYPIARIECTGLSAPLSLRSYFSGVLSGNELEISRMDVILRDNFKVMTTPHLAGEILWQFDRIRCKDLNIRFETEKQGSFSLRTPSAYVYSPNSQRGAHSLVIQGGTLKLRGWPAIDIQESHILSTYNGLEEITLKGSIDMGEIGIVQEDKAEISMKGSILEGKPVEGEFTLISSNLDLSYLTQKKFTSIITAKTRLKATTGVATDQQQLSMTLPATAATGELLPPVFNGKVLLKNIRLDNRRLPAIPLLMQHVESNRRDKYSPPTFQMGSARIIQQGEKVSIEILQDDLSDPAVLTVQGKITVDKDGILSGFLHYGLPLRISQAEYRGESDPLFEEIARLAWLYTRLSGTADAPTDNADALDQKAAAARAKMPAPHSLLMPTIIIPGQAPTPSPPTKDQGTPVSAPGTSPAPSPAMPGTSGLPSPESDTDDIFLRTLQQGH